MRILGIETSCDETAAAVVKDGRLMLSNVVASSLDLHKAYGGVVPEIAARSHLEVITLVINQALQQAKTSWSDIDAVAVTQGPGLSGSLLIGVMTARSLAIAKAKPLYALNHVEAHIYATFITETPLKGYKLSVSRPPLPLLALIVSGGHSQLVLLDGTSSYKVLGRTLDDAVGEAFDKVAKMIGLPYPGGPSIAGAASAGDPKAIRLPKAQTRNPYDFSFSGLKTAVLRAAQANAGEDYTFPSSQLPQALSDGQKKDLAASFQAAAVDTLVDALARAQQEYHPQSVVIVGGVAANQYLRTAASARLPTPVIYPDIKLCTDNAAMIAALPFFKKIKPADPYRLDIKPSLRM